MKRAQRQRRRRRQWRKNRTAEDARSIHDVPVPDDLLRLILLRLDSPIWVMRAVSACKRWRRVVTDGADQGRTFLRLARSLHLPTVVGQYHNQHMGYIKFVLSSSFMDGSRFSVDFRERNSCWHVADCHGGLLLLRTSYDPRRPSMPTTIVYDPLTCQRWPISHYPPPSNELDYDYSHSIKDTFLFEGDGDGNISISNFRVLYWLDGAAATGPDACVVFSTANGGEWDWRFFSDSEDEDAYARHCYGDVAGRADDGSLYLGLMMPSGLGSCRIVTIDGMFSKVDLPIRMPDPASCSESTFTLVHAAGAIGPTSPQRTRIVHVRGEELELFHQVHGSGEWVLEHRIPNLSVATRGLSICVEKKKCMVWRTMGSLIADGSTFAILSACSVSLHSYINTHQWFFSFDVNTMELQVLPQELYRDSWEILNYTLPWPQFLRACPCS